MEMEKLHLVQQVLDQAKKTIVGKDQALLQVLLTILARGHVLLEDIPGVGKTTMALAFSKALGLQYKRVQFTPDVMPSDITGFSLYNRSTGRMEYQPGAVLCNLFLADELNRASSRTQSALLEAMEEGQVTVDGTTHPVPKPFFVIATQNPAGASGTQLLPDSQLDRFTLRLSIGYPTRQQEAQMVRQRQGGNPLDQVQQVMDRQELENLCNMVQEVYLCDEVLDYLLRLVEETRRDSRIRQGASPRATLSLVSVSRAMAFAHGRDYVVPEDVAGVFANVIGHRMLYQQTPGQMGRGKNPDLLAEILGRVKAPKLR